MKKIYQFSNMRAIVYWKPGENLDDLSLKKLHANLLKVNVSSGANLKHGLLKTNLSLDEIRKLHQNSVISEFIIGHESVAFLISPILNGTDRPILHSGLMIIGKNPGARIMELLFLINVRYSFKKLGSYYVTNITSTPSAIEGFCEIVSGSWPGPNVALRKVPRGYKDIVQKLKTDYLDFNFPDSDQINVDYKRFVMTSKSSEMGFKTNYYKVSRANNLKYNLFCHSWINYEEEEDIIQVGEMSFYNYVRSRVVLFFLLRSFKKLKLKEFLKAENNDNAMLEKKAA